MEKYDGVLICPGSSREQADQFKRIFIKDNLYLVQPGSFRLQLSAIPGSDIERTLDVFINEQKVGHFLVLVVDVRLIDTLTFVEINKMAEKLIKEETMYGLKDSDGLDRVNKALLTGWGDYEHYPTITEKAAALWYKIARNQFFLNGNKRTALLSAIWFLKKNMYTFKSSDVHKMYDISVLAAYNEKSIQEINEFISENVSLDYDAMLNAVQNE